MCYGSSNLIALGPTCFRIFEWVLHIEQRLNTQGLRLLQHRRRRALNALKCAKQRSAAKGIVLDEQADRESIPVMSEDARGHRGMSDLLVFQCTNQYKLHVSSSSQACPQQSQIAPDVSLQHCIFREDNHPQRSL